MKLIQLHTLKSEYFLAHAKLGFWAYLHFSNDPTHSFINETPDHSLLNLTFHVGCEMFKSDAIAEVDKKICHKRKVCRKLPNDFLCSDLRCSALLELLNRLEVCHTTQKTAGMMIYVKYIIGKWENTHRINIFYSKIKESSQNK